MFEVTLYHKVNTVKRPNHYGRISIDQIALRTEGLDYHFPRMNEPTAVPDSTRCPVCNIKLPFSLAMHMVAAHSSNAIENPEKTPDVAFGHVKASSYHQPRAN